MLAFFLGAVTVFDLPGLGFNPHTLAEVTDWSGKFWTLLLASTSTLERESGVQNFVVGVIQTPSCRFENRQCQMCFFRTKNWRRSEDLILLITSGC